MFSVLAAGLAMILVSAPSAYAAQAPVGLGTVGGYSVLGGSTVTNTGSTILAGDLGVSPGTAITGFPPGIARGATHAADAAAGQAQSDLTIAYDDAAGRATTKDVAGDLVGQTLPGGVYTSSGPLKLTGTLTLDAQGDKATVFVFKVSSTLVTGSASHVTLVNGAQACNVFWQVGSSATLGTGSQFVGTIMALASITVTTGTTVEGRALARTGAVTLDSNTFTTPGCETSSQTPPSGPGTPGTPGTPETPGTPGTPGTPETPGTPGTPPPTDTVRTPPSTPDSPPNEGTGVTPPNGSLADTGASSAGILGGLAALLLVGVTLLMVVRRRRINPHVQR